MVDTSWVFDANTLDIERKSKEELALLKAEKKKELQKQKKLVQRLILIITRSCGATTWLTHAEDLMTYKK